MHTDELLIQGALANISEVGWRQDLAIKILEKYLYEKTNILAN